MGGDRGECAPGVFCERGQQRAHLLQLAHIALRRLRLCAERDAVEFGLGKSVQPRLAVPNRLRPPVGGRQPASAIRPPTEGAHRLRCPSLGLIVSAIRSGTLCPLGAAGHYGREQRCGEDAEWADISL